MKDEKRCSLCLINTETLNVAICPVGVFKLDSVCILFSVSLSSFLISHFLTWGKPKSFHTSVLKLAEASTVSQTLYLGSPSPLLFYN